MKDDLPKGWTEVDLNNLCTVIMGQAPPGSECNTEGRGTVFVKAGEFSKEFPVVREWTTRPLKMAKLGDVLICVVGATSGKLNLGIDCAIGRSVAALRPNTSLLTKLLYYQLQPMVMQLRAGSTGSAQGVIAKDDLEQIPLRLPPRLEQMRIVAMLEVLLTKVEDCQTRIAKIPVFLKRFRQSVLSAACSGRLTVDWREQNPSDVDVAVVLDKIRRRWESSTRTAAQRQREQRIFSRSEENDSGDLPAGWRFVKLNKLCQSFDYGTSSKSKPVGKIPVLRMGNIQNGNIDWSDLVYTSDTDEIRKYSLRAGTVLFNRTNSPELVGKTAIYRGERPAIFAGYLIRINPFPDLDPEYLNLCLNTSYAKGFCRSVKTDGVSQSNINAQKLGAFEVALCPLAEQKEIVRRVEKLFALANKIDTAYKDSGQRVEHLSKSILAKAFKGELVSTEAELADAEGRAYETAEQLLKRIQTVHQDDSEDRNSKRQSQSKATVN
jgi:type I restriction enzyme S subunit